MDNTVNRFEEAVSLIEECREELNLTYFAMSWLKNLRFPTESHIARWTEDGQQRLSRIIGEIDKQLKALTLAQSLKDREKTTDAANCDPLLLEVLNFIEYARSLQIITGYGNLADAQCERVDLRDKADTLYKKLDAVKWGVPHTGEKE